MSFNDELEDNTSESDWTVEDTGIDALCQIVAREAVQKVTDAIAQLRNVSPIDAQLIVEIKYRVMEQFLGVMEMQMGDLEAGFQFGGFRFHRYGIQREFCDETLDDEFEWECRCGATFKGIARDVLEGRHMLCKDCAAAGSDCASRAA